MSRTAQILAFPARQGPTPGERAAFRRGVEHARTMARKRAVVLWSHERPQRSGGAVALGLLTLILIAVAAWAYGRLTGAA